MTPLTLRPAAVLRAGWVHWFAPLVLAGWLLVGCLYVLARHDSFRTGTYDQGYYTQIVWNTSQGRWFATSIKPPSYLADHFAPLLALLAPFFWIFPDARVLLLAKVAALGVTIMPAYWIVRDKYPGLAPWLVASFVLNPLLHSILRDTGDFHELILAAPPLALAVYALYRQRPWLLCAALAATLLSREEMGLYVAPLGAYLILFQPKWRRLGIGIVVGTVLWSILVFGVLVPAIANRGYGYVAYFTRDSSVLASIVSGQWPDGSVLANLFFAPEKIRAMLLMLTPLALLPLISRGWPLVWIPGVIFLAAIPRTAAGALTAYYPSPIMALLWGSAAFMIAGVSPQRAKWATGLVVAATLICSWLYGPLSAAQRFRGSDFALTDHDRLGPQFLAQIPPEVALAAQSGLGSHLATREQFRMWPWLDESRPPELLVLDRQGNDTYPFTSDELKREILGLQLDPKNRLLHEQDGYLIFAVEPEAQFQRLGPWQWLPYLQLEGYSLYQTDEAGAFREAPFRPTGGRVLRIELYWQSLEQMTESYKISVAVTAPDGFILAQHDSWPGQNTLLTTEWAPGRVIRDTHYVSLPNDELPQPLSLAVVVYETSSLKRLAPEEGVVLTQDISAISPR